MKCDECHNAFSPLAEESRILEKVFAPSLPVPHISKCSECRMRQRLAFRNERKLYRRVSSLSGKPIISVYRPEAPFTVYDQAEWWGDEYDPLAYGREVDFSLPFFAQLEMLHREVPKLSIHNAKSENSEYTNYSAENRNCYLVVGGLGAEDCLYSYRVFDSKNVVDCFGLSRCELCYECAQGSDLYRCMFATNCHSSSDLFLCEDCIGCRDCFGCSNLKNRQHFIFNEAVSAKEYGARVAELKANLESSRARYYSLRERLPLRSTYTVNCEGSLGDQLRNCRNCQDVFFVYDSEDVIHARNAENDRDCMDLNFGDNCELQYQASNLEKNYRVAFAALAWYVTDSFYVLSCFNSQNLFGCCGMKKNAYCVLNRQYRPEEYEKVVKKITAHMVETGEWGKFFPPSLSPFLFSETVAAELFPLTQEECRRRGYNSGMPDEIKDAAQKSAATTICRACSKAFRMIAQELSFYQALEISSPQLCPDCRHTHRLSTRRPMTLKMTTCTSCREEIPSTAAGDTILCEACYTASSD